MNVTLVAGIITGLFMVAVAVITGLWARANKRVPEPTPIEKLWTRLDDLEAKSATQQGTIDKQHDDLRHLKDEVATLQEQVVAYRGGFLAQVSWAARVKEQWTGSVPIVTFTAEEERLINRGLDMASLQQVHEDR